MALCDDQVHEAIDGPTDINRVDLGPWRHHLEGDLVSELDDGVNHHAFVLFEYPLFLTRIDERLDFFLGSLLIIVGFDFPLVEVIENRGNQPHERAEHEIGCPEHRKKAFERGFGIAKSDCPRYELTERQDHQQRRQDRRREGDCVGQRVTQVRAGKQHGKRHQESLDTDVDGHQHVVSRGHERDHQPVLLPGFALRNPA